MHDVPAMPGVPISSPLGEPVWEIATLYPDQGHWTEEEYLALDTNRLIEFTNGRLEFLPMPTPFHQLILDFLHSQLKAFVAAHSLGKVLFAPLRIRVAKDKIREPDLVYFKPGRIKDKHRPPHGADLVMEIVSPGVESRQRDLRAKRRDYAAAGIAEYWIVDPEERAITVLALSGDRYRQHGKFRPGHDATSALLKGFAVSVSATFAAAEEN
jgi:Uma2 family endonuclease